MSVTPYLPVRMALAGHESQHGARERRGELPSDPGCQRPGNWRGEQPVEDVEALRADRREQDERLYSVRRGRGDLERDAAAIGVADEHGALDGAGVKRV